MEFKWEDGFTINVNIDGSTTIISANKEGLISLANHLVALSKEAPGYHFHLDEYNSLEDNSSELIIVRIE